ncbi:MAG: non-canonical purine NTP pyrophosphatase [Patescibacteria group bacterium]
MKLIFVTSNKHKVEEIGFELKKYGVELEQVNIGYGEDKDADMEEVAKKAAKELAEKLQKPIIMEDTGLYFNAYNNFPGAMPKFVFNSIGFDGIFRLLEGKDRSAYFRTIIGFCEPGSEPVLFAGEMRGEITDEVHEPEKDGMPYGHIFIPEGHNKTCAEMSVEEKSLVSQRGEAARKLGEFLKNNFPVN